MKKIILSVVFVFLSFGLVPHAVVAEVQNPPQRSPSENGFVPLAPINNLTTGDAVNSPDLANFFNALYKYLIGASAVLAIIMIMWGGMEISTQDSIGAHSEGKERITQAILGLIIVLSPVLVFSIINPAILNLSIGLKPLILPPVTSGGNETTELTARATTFANALVQAGRVGNNRLYPCDTIDCATAKQACTRARSTPGFTDSYSGEKLCLKAGGQMSSEPPSEAIGCRGRHPEEFLIISCNMNPSRTNTP